MYKRVFEQTLRYVLAARLDKTAMLAKMADAPNKGIHARRESNTSSVAPRVTHMLQPDEYIDVLSGSTPSKLLYATPAEASKYNTVAPVYTRGGDNPRGKGKLIGYAPAGGGLLGGKAYNENYNIDNVRKGQTAIINISGAQAPLGKGYQALTYMSSDMGIPLNNIYKFRYTDVKKAQQLAKDLMDRGVNVRIIGHSRGGDTADLISSNLQSMGYNPKTYLIDPVSRNLIFGRNTKLRTPNATVLQPTDKTVWGTGDKKKFNMSNLVARVGGRFAVPQDKVRQYEGDHINGFEGDLRLITHLRSGELPKLESTRKGRE